MEKSVLCCEKFSGKMLTHELGKIIPESEKTIADKSGAIAGSNVGWMQPHSLIARNGASGGKIGRWILTLYTRSSAFLLMDGLHFRRIETTVFIQCDVVFDQPNRRDQ